MSRLYTNSGRRSSAFIWLVLAVLSLGMMNGERAARISLAHVVDSDGSVQIVGADGFTCGGWQIMLDPLLRARFVDTDGQQEACTGESPQRTSSYWDDELTVAESRFQIRTIAVSHDETYVTGRFELGTARDAVSGILRWSAHTGKWSVVSSTTRPL